jgi:hypothetical protein
VKELWNVPRKMYHLLINGAHESIPIDSWPECSTVKVSIGGAGGNPDGEREEEESPEEYYPDSDQRSEEEEDGEFLVDIYSREGVFGILARPEEYVGKILERCSLDEMGWVGFRVGSSAKGEPQILADQLHFVKRENGRWILHMKSQEDWDRWADEEEEDFEEGQREDDPVPPWYRDEEDEDDWMAPQSDEVQEQEITEEPADPADEEEVELKVESSAPHLIWMKSIRLELIQDLICRLWTILEELWNHIEGCRSSWTNARDLQRRVEDPQSSLLELKQGSALSKETSESVENLPLKLRQVQNQETILLNTW